jgi:hypothetical protein
MGKNYNSSRLVNGLSVDASGNVGVGGTPSGSYKFEVTGTGRFTGASIFGSNLTIQNAGILSIYRTDNTRALQLYTTGNECVVDAWEASSEPLMLRSNGTVGRIVLHTNGAERMRITNAGNVGIGTTSPFNFGAGHKTLDVRGDGTTSIGALFVGNSDRTAVLGFYMNPNATGTVGTSSNHALQLVTNDAERMRITSGGSVGIGVVPKSYASTWAGFQVGNFSLMGPNPASDQNAILGANAYRATDNSWKRIIGGYGNLIEFNQGSGDIRFYTGGTGSADSTISLVSGPFLVNGGASWTNGSSDIRKKKNFEPSQGLAEVLQIEAVKYHFNWDDDNSIKRLGFKAQNLQTIIPEMVMETGELAEDGTNYLTITPDYLLPVLVKAIQELKAELDSLKQLVK